MGLAKDYEWFAAFGLLVTIVWLYLEILRLLVQAAPVTRAAGTGGSSRRSATAVAGGAARRRSLVVRRARDGRPRPSAPANGAISGWRGIYRWRRASGWLAVLLDSTWGAGR